TTTDDAGTSTTIIPGLVTIEENAKKKNDVKARSMLLMALTNEHLMTFNQYKDAKYLFAAIETRFGGNEANKKTQKTFLKQLYENFSATDIESLDLIFNRLQKLVSQLAILVWRNKSDLDIMNLDDLYNNFKIIKQEVRGTTSTNTSSQNMAFVSSPNPNSTNEVPPDFGVSTASPQVSTANLSDATVGPRNQENRTKNQETIRRKVNVENISSKAMVAIDGAGFDWSYMADDEAPTNMAFVALLGSETLKIVVQKIRKDWDMKARMLSQLLTLEDFAEPSVQSHRVNPIELVTPKSSVKISAPVKENNGAPLIED
nr:ribonuclease H-like domain-containing protein [Tanacetum cinerariifolium]